MVLVVKNLPANVGDVRLQVQSLGWEDSLEKGMATHSRVLAWRIPWTEEPGRSHGVEHDWSHGITQSWTQLKQLNMPAGLYFMYVKYVKLINLFLSVIYLSRIRSKPKGKEVTWFVLVCVQIALLLHFPLPSIFQVRKMLFANMANQSFQLKTFTPKGVVLLYR